MSNSYDVVIVGAGPAGSTAARYLAQTDFKVLLVDRVNCIGNKIQCAEYVPNLIGQVAPVRSNDIAQKVKGIKTFINGQLMSTIEAPGYVLNRNQWDKNLGDLSYQAGAKVALSASVTDIYENGVRFQSGLSSTIAECKVLIGCDGPNSIVSKSLGNSQQESSIALQYEMKLAGPSEYVDIYFDPNFVGGYAWMFPKGTTANVGIGVYADCKGNIEKMLNEFCKYLMDQRVLKDLTILGKTAGLVPAGGLAARLADDRTLIAGDAAGCTNPITGAGIMSAVMSGKQAAESVIEHFRNPSLISLPDCYTKAMIEQFGNVLKRAQQKKIYRNTRWTRDPEKFVEIIRNSWIAFPEYYEA